MAADFRTVLTCVTIGGMKDTDEYLVNDIAFSVFYLTIVQGIWFSLCQALMVLGGKDFIDDGEATFPADTDDCYGTARTGGRSTDDSFQC